VTALAAAGRSYALLADGTTVEIRPAGPDDTEAVLRFHLAMSPDNLYLRFFSMSKRAAEQEAQRVCRPAGADHAALLALLGEQVVGLASYEPTATPGVAEVAFAVADDMHGRGIATLLLEHLVSLGRARQVRTFAATTLPENTAMLRVFADAGLSVRRRLVEDVIEVTMPLPREEAALGADNVYLDAVAGREQRADVASLAPLLAPQSVAVVGASRKPGSIGRTILLNIRDAGFTGALYAVNPHADNIEGVPCLPSVAALPGPADMVVIAVPPPAVLRVARECGKQGTRALVVITSGLGVSGDVRLLQTCRQYGMRLVGPNCFGVAVPGMGLDATFGARHPATGTAGLVVQSGGVGIALLEHFSRLGIGISSFVSIGDKMDVSGNDLLMWWEQDAVTKLAVLYLESFGNPRKFARTARRVSDRMPVLTVHAGRSAPGQRAAASHTAAAAAALIPRQALFEQAGVIATTSLGELLDAAALLANQPVPAGRRVAIVTNAGGAGVLAADACVEAGLSVHVVSRRTQARLRRLLPKGAAVAGPVDTTAGVAAQQFIECLLMVAEDHTHERTGRRSAGHGAGRPHPNGEQPDGGQPDGGQPDGGQPDAGHQGGGRRAGAAGNSQPGVDRPAGEHLAGERPAGRQPGSQSTGEGPPDAVIALIVPTAAGNLVPALQEVRLPVPLAAVILDQAETVRLLATTHGGPAVPAYAYPEAAARALGRAASYSAWRSRPAGTVPELTRCRPGDARKLVAAFLGRMPGGGWLSPAEADELLRCYGIPVVESRFTHGAAQTIAAAAALGGHVALKADVLGLVHKSGAGAVELNLRGAPDVRRAVRRLEGRFGDKLSGLLVQPMIADGTELIIGVVQEPVFGPLVVFGLGGVATEMLGDHAARLAPLTDTDADDLIHSIRAAPLLLGHQGQPAADLDAIRDTLLRISLLADDLPEVTELDLNPVIARPDGVFAVDARIRVTSRWPADPFLRQLRQPHPAEQPHPAPDVGSPGR
jgi:acyl-CoA synthetase (NDP forming)/RimJ/RimL family protein N-acetyltransferase